MPSSAAVVEILKSTDTFVSGEEIAGTLGVSRASVWKRINGLRDMGFDISASTNLGYHLVSVPDLPASFLQLSNTQSRELKVVGEEYDDSSIFRISVSYST